MRKFDILTAYRTWGADIKKWRLEEDQRLDPPVTTTYLSFYTDPVRDAGLLNLDGEKQALASGLSLCQTLSTPVFVRYGKATLHSINPDWAVLNRDNWGIVVDDKIKTRYIGNLKGGIPHGKGRMTYLDGTEYTGDWFFGGRDGFGKLTRDEIFCRKGFSWTTGIGPG